MSRVGRQRFLIAGKPSACRRDKPSGDATAVSDYTADVEDIEAEDEDLSGFDEFTVGKKIQISLADMDLQSWKHDLAADLLLIEQLLASMQLVAPEHDAKLLHLKTLLAEKIDTPLNPGNKKVLIFTAFADTANYLYANIAPDMLKLRGLHTGKVTGSGDDNVLTAKSSEIAYRKDQLKRMQEEVIELEDVKTGISITDLGLNDFRMDLLNYVKDHGDLENMPNGLHAVVPAQEDRGLVPGAIFALRNIHDTVNVNQQCRLHPYYLVYISNDGDIIADHTEVKRLLDLVRTSSKGQSSPIQSVCRLFNEHTQDGKNMGQYSELLKPVSRGLRPSRVKSVRLSGSRASLPERSSSTDGLASMRPCAKQSKNWIG